VVKSVDPDAIEREVRALVARWVAKFPEVEEVIWFGSWVRGAWGPGSDVDLCVILTRDSRRVQDRIPDFLPRQFPVGLDVFPYTRAEFDSLARTQPGWHREILSHGRVIFSRNDSRSTSKACPGP
jgi:hypothetical protein